MLEVAITRSVGAFTLRADIRAARGVTAIFGPSGAGKTTLARCVAGLAQPDDGHITLDGTDLFRAGGVTLPPHRRNVGYVFQEPRLFPHMNVRANLLYGAAKGTDPTAVADMLGISDLMRRRPAGLSGGEAARIAIGRALLRRPGLLILDEPLAALDAARRATILPWLEGLRDQGVPILYISHAMDEVARLADTLVLMRGGAVVHAGPIGQALSDPALAPLIGPSQAGAMLEGQVTGQADGLMQVATDIGPLFVPGAAQSGARLRLRVGADDVILSTTAPQGVSARNVIPATVNAIQMGQGPGAMVRLEAGQGFLLARVTRRAVTDLDLRPGKQVWAMFKTTSFARGDVGGG